MLRQVTPWECQASHWLYAIGDTDGTGVTAAL